MFGGNGGKFRFIIGNKKYPKVLEGLSILGGSEPPPLGSNGYLAKILSTSLGIFVCTLISSISLGVWGLDFTPTTIWAGVVTNETSITITID
jgi:hypothetical protein